MHIQLRGISKQFNTLLANDEVNLDIMPGEVLALLGENGAGKSTLMKILYGFYQADEGCILIDDQMVTIDSPHTAMAMGIGMVFQQFSLIENLTVAENLMLTSTKTSKWQWGDRTHWVNTHSCLSQLAPTIQPTNRVHNLTVSEKQLVELVKVLDADARVIILDEPSSVLTPLETQRFWTLIRQLADQGYAVVLITHKLEDVLACADRIAVMRKGRVVEVCLAHNNQNPGLEHHLSSEYLIHLMVGQTELPVVHPAPPSLAYPLLHIQNLWVGEPAAVAKPGQNTVRGIDLAIASGEIIGIAGVAGNGQQTLADAMAGLLPLAQGTVHLDGALLHQAGIPYRARHDIAYIPEQPLQNGVATDLDLVKNLVVKDINHMPFFPRRAKQRAHALQLIQAFNVQPPNPDQPAGNLSGGNLQKLVLARELSGSPSLIIACYPTMGLDISATQFIYEKLFNHAQTGACILWISESLDDLLRYSHRIAVLFQGEIVGIAETRRASRQLVGKWMTSGRQAA